MDFAAEDRQFLLKTACATIRHRLQGAGAPPSVTSPSAAMVQPAGCFVSLHARQTHALRGCIGRVDATGPLIEALLGAAWSVLDDPRFARQPVTLEELPALTVEISVLGPLEAAANPLAFEPRDDGIYLTIADRAGLFLPQVARETGWTREQLLDRLCTEKLGIPARSWQLSQATLQIFHTVTIGPVGFMM